MSWQQVNGKVEKDQTQISKNLAKLFYMKSQAWKREIFTENYFVLPNFADLSFVFHPFRLWEKNDGNFWWTKYLSRYNLLTQKLTFRNEG